MCGIIGINKIDSPAILELYEGLLMLQHRGQDAAGMVTFDKKSFYEKKNNGLVRDVFKEKDIYELKGSSGLGHVRYPTAGTLSAQEAQPFFVNAPFGIYLVHNGNITNTAELTKKIQKTYRRHLKTTSDSEVLLNILADNIYRIWKNNSTKEENETDVIFQAVKSTMNELSGAYSVIALIDSVGIVAFRDPNGIRPLAIGKKETEKGTEWCIASENIAFKVSGYDFYRDVAPGEVILITPDGKIKTYSCQSVSHRPCVFEYIYFARPDSMLDEISVYKTQIRLGIALAKQIKKANLSIDSIMPVPDSARPVALEISKQLGIKYSEGLVKNRYIGRTFIMPDQNSRTQSVRRKLNTIEIEFRNRAILLVDDSIIRGTTMKQIVEMCRQAGANKIYIASAAPALRHPCTYGVDMPKRSEFIAHKLSHEEIKQKLNVDALFFQKIDDLIKACKVGNQNIKAFCTGCFNGRYAIEDTQN